MKILYIVHQFYPEYYTGTERFILNMAMMLQKAGHSVKVITYSFYQDSFYDQMHGNILFKEFSFKSVPVLALRNRKIPDDIGYSLDNKELLYVAQDIISREKPDVVHVGHTKNVGELVRALKPLNIPYLLTLTDFFLMCPKYILVTSKNTLCHGPQGGTVCQSMCPEFEYELVTKRLEKARDILFHAKMVVSPSNFLARIFQQEFPELNLRVINFGVKYSTVEINKKNYSDGASVTFCSTGTLNPHKGIHVLIEAFKRVRSDRIFLKIYGLGPDEVYISTLKELAQGDERIEFCGVYTDENIGGILTDVDVLVVPSVWHENAPMVLRQAMACNVPAIVSDTGGMQEDIKDHVNGLAFRMGDVGHLAEVLEQIAENPSLLNRLKRNLRKTRVPSVEQEAYQYSRLYQELLE